MSTSCSATWSSRLAAVQMLPAEIMPNAVSSTVQLDVAEDPPNRLRDIWAGAGGQLKASFTLQATVAADTFDWQDEAPPVTRIEALAVPRPRVPAPDALNRANTPATTAR